MTLMSVIVAFLFAISLWYLSSNHKVTFVKLKATDLKFLPNRSWHRLIPAGGTFVSATGGTFQSDTPGTFVFAMGGTFDSDMPGTFESDTGGTFNPLLSSHGTQIVPWLFIILRFPPKSSILPLQSPRKLSIFETVPSAWNTGICGHRSWIGAGPIPGFILETGPVKVLSFRVDCCSSTQPESLVYRGIRAQIQSHYSNRQSSRRGYNCENNPDSVVF